MRLHVHRTGEAFLAALQSSDAAYYVAFDRSAANPRVLRDAERIGNERGLTDLASAPELRARAEILLQAYFEEASREDTENRYAYSSRVLLAVPDYPDIALVFILRALRELSGDSTLHALIQDEWKAALVSYEANRANKPTFRAGARRGLARAARSLARHFLNGNAPKRCDVLIFTLGDALVDGGRDSYFGNLASAMQGKCGVLTVYAAPGKRLRLAASESIAPLEAYLKPRDALGAWSASRDVDAGTHPDAITDYLRAREHASGEVAMLELMSRAFDSMLARLKPKTIVYPFENRSWEKNLLRAARKHGVRRCVGYQHSSITPRHLAFTSAAGLAGLADLPDAIVTCGEVTAALIAACIPQARSLVSVGTALRAARLDVPPPPVTFALLAPISSSRAEAWEILRFLHDVSRDSAVPMIVRAHPTIPIDDLYSQFDWPAHVQLSRRRTLAQDLAACSVVAYSSSTVALEGMLYGRLPVYLDIGDVPSGDPLAGDHAFVTRVRDSAELRDAIDRIRALDSPTLDSMRQEARQYAERYLIEPTPANVERMAGMIAEC